MKNGWLILLVLLIGVTGETAWSTCPNDPNDRGECDTMYIEPWQSDLEQYTPGAGPYFVRVPIYVTCDVADECDSIAAFVIPLCYTHTNPEKYCSLSGYWNEILWNENRLPRSIFRHLPDNTDPQIHNWMMDLYDFEEGQEWNTVILELASDTGQYASYGWVAAHFWLSLIPSGTEDQRFISGSRILLSTMTFKFEDSMHVCIDTCLWPPHSRINWNVSKVGTEGCDFGFSKIPRSGTGDTLSFQVCFNFGTSDVKEINAPDEIRPTGFSLSQNYPNPFNPTTNFRFTLPKSSHVKIEIFNIVGQRVATVVDGDMKAGLYTADWNGRDESGKTVSSGIYFYRMRADDFSDMKKMVLVK